MNVDWQLPVTLADGTGVVEDLAVDGAHLRPAPVLRPPAYPACPSLPRCPP
ncbi:hypothetical protein ACFQ3Z_01105 [Streptomyces nogalater]